MEADDPAPDGDADLLALMPAAAAIPIAPGANLAGGMTIGGHQVHFDGWSHVSGDRRAFVTCKAHMHCRKYQFLNQFKSERECCAWLVAWLKTGEDLPMQICHCYHIPPRSAIEELLSQ